MANTENTTHTTTHSEVVDTEVSTEVVDTAVAKAEDFNLDFLAPTPESNVPTLAKDDENVKEARADIIGKINMLILNSEDEKKPRLLELLRANKIESDPLSIKEAYNKMESEAFCIVLGKGVGCPKDKSDGYGTLIVAKIGYNSKDNEFICDGVFTLRGSTVQIRVLMYQMGKCTDPIFHIKKLHGGSQGTPVMYTDPRTGIKEEKGFTGYKITYSEVYPHYVKEVHSITSAIWEDIMRGVKVHIIDEGEDPLEYAKLPEWASDEVVKGKGKYMPKKGKDAKFYQNFSGEGKKDDERKYNLMSAYLGLKRLFSDDYDFKALQLEVLGRELVESSQMIALTD